MCYYIEVFLSEMLYNNIFLTWCETPLHYYYSNIVPAVQLYYNICLSYEPMEHITIDTHNDIFTDTYFICQFSNSVDYIWYIHDSVDYLTKTFNIPVLHLFKFKIFIVWSLS